MTETADRLRKIAGEHGHISYARKDCVLLGMAAALREGARLAEEKITWAVQHFGHDAPMSVAGAEGTAQVIAAEIRALADELEGKQK